MNLSQKRYIISILFLALWTNGCRRSIELPETIDAEFLRYDVSYLEELAGDIPTRILPSHMDTYYTRHFILTRIEGFFSQFSLTQIANLRRKEVTTLLNFFGNKVYYSGKNGELPAGIIPLNALEVRPTGDYKTIAGLESERIEVETETETFDIYCTRDITVRRPNITTPYHSVDFVLSDFRIQLSLLKMHLTCITHETKTIDSEIFLIPEDYKPVSRKSMEQIINSLFTKD